MTREEQLACLKDRPCDVCKMRTDKGCSSWECVFEQTPDEEKEPCEDCISRKAVLDEFYEYFADYDLASIDDYENYTKIVKALPSIQPTAKENLVVGDCISREEVCDYIAEFVNHEYATDREREMVKHIIGGIQHLPSVQPTTKGNLVVGDCISREFIEIVVNYPPADLCAYPEYKGKPYYSIKYRENGKEYVGFGTYKIEILSQWIKQYFVSDIQPKTGHWIEEKSEVYKCSNCGRYALEWGGKLKMSRYCPNCGAKMLPTDSEKE